MKPDFELESDHLKKIQMSAESISRVDWKPAVRPLAADGGNPHGRCRQRYTPDTQTASITTSGIPSRQRSIFGFSKQLDRSVPTDGHSALLLRASGSGQRLLV